MNHKIKKIIKISIVILILGFIWHFFHPLRLKVDKEYDAFLVQKLDSSLVINTKIKVQGNYYFSLFSKERFQGEIIIDYFKETAYHDVDLRFRNGVDSLGYIRVMNNRYTGFDFGFISAGFVMKDLMIDLPINSSVYLNEEMNDFITTNPNDLKDVTGAFERLQKKIRESFDEYDT